MTTTSCKLPAILPASTAPRLSSATTAIMASQTPAVVMDNGTGFSKLGFAGNDSPSFVFPTAIATKGAAGGGGSSGSGRPAVGQKPSYLTGGTGGGSSGGNLSAKRGAEDLDYFIGDEALAQAAGPGMTLEAVALARYALWSGILRSSTDG